jgi:hypothetical protein
MKDTSEFKDSCECARELIKQFLTFSAAGIAFVLGVAYAGKPSGFSVCYVALSIGLLAASIICGLISFMCIVGNTKTEKNYDIDEPSVKWLTIFQIFLFCGGVLTLFFPTLQTASAHEKTHACSHTQQ